MVDYALPAELGRTRLVRGQPAGVGVLPGPGDRDPVAGDVRRGQRLLPIARHGRAARSARRSDRARQPPRRRHRLGVPVPVRRRLAAVDQRPVAGHGAAGARASVVAHARNGLPGRGARSARGLPGAAVRGRARTAAGRLALPRVHLRAGRAHPQRLRPVAGGPVRIRQADGGRGRPGAVRSRRRRRTGGNAALRHRRVVVIRPALRIGPLLPRTAGRIPRTPVREDA